MSTFKVQSIKTEHLRMLLDISDSFKMTSPLPRHGFNLSNIPTKDTIFHDLNDYLQTEKTALNILRRDSETELLCESSIPY